MQIIIIIRSVSKLIYYYPKGSLHNAIDVVEMNKRQLLCIHDCFYFAFHVTMQRPTPTVLYYIRHHTNVINFITTCTFIVNKSISHAIYIFRVSMKMFLRQGSINPMTI